MPFGPALLVTQARFFPCHVGVARVFHPLYAQSCFRPSDNTSAGDKIGCVRDLIETLLGFCRPIGVQLNATALAPGPLRNNGESPAFARAWVEYGETGGGECEVLPDAAGFSLG